MHGMEGQRKAILADFPTSKQLIDIAAANRQFADGMLVQPGVPLRRSRRSGGGAGGKAR